MADRLGVPDSIPIRYTGPDADIVPIKRFPRRPLTTDKKFPTGQLALLGKNPSTGSEGELWYLAYFNSSGDAIWLQLTSGAGGGGIDRLETDDGPTGVGPDGAGVVDVLGGTGIVTSGQDPSTQVTIAVDTSVVTTQYDADTGSATPSAGVLNLTGGTGIDTSATGNTVTFTLDLTEEPTIATTYTADSGSATPAANNLNILGGAGVTTSGSGDTITIALSGGGAAIDSVGVDANTGPGTNPVVPDANGLITVNGAAVAAHSVPIETHSRAANVYNIEVQYGAAAASTTATSSGVVHFDSAAFTVDANGFVELVGGGGSPAYISTNVDNNTPPGTNPVVADGSGQITVGGAAVAAHSVPVDIHSRAANAYNVEVQYASAAGSTTATSSGICHFDNTDFAVDANGFVTFTGGSSGPTPEFILGNLFFWDDFISGGHTQNTMQLLGWQGTNAEWGNLDNEHPGVLIAGGGGTTRIINNGSETNNGHIKVGGGEITLIWVIKQGALASSGSYTQRVGFFDALGTINNGIYFQYTDTANSGAWQLITKNGGSTTTANSADTVTTDWTALKIVVNAAGTSVSFFVDDVECANSPVATNIPTGGLYIGYDFTRTTDNNTHYADLMIVQKALTSARY